MQKLGFKRSPYDCCLYIRQKKGLQMYLVLYVDDIILASESEADINEIKHQLSNEFDMEDMAELKNFLGIRIRYDVHKGMLQFDQTKYINDMLKRFGMENCKPISTPLDANVKLEAKKDAEKITQHPYRELIGCLTYLMVSSRPDLSIAVNLLSRFQSGATEQHWNHLKRILRYLQGTKQHCLQYQRSEEADPLTGFADASWGDDVNDRRSTSGYIFQVFGNTIAWTTRKQVTVALSSTEAEYVSLSSSACEAIWLRNLVSEFGIILESPVVLHEDNQSCIRVAEEPRDQKRMKHLDIRYCFIRECIQNKQIQLKFIPTQHQLADCFTKALPLAVFKKHCAALGLRGDVGIHTTAN